MLKRSALRRLLPAGLVTGVVGLALLLPAAPLAAVFAGYSFYAWGGVLSSGPGVDAVSFTENVFVEGQDRALWYRSIQPVSASSTQWASLGGVIVSDPGATQLPSGDVYVFVRGQDNAVWWNSGDGNSFSGWVSLGGVVVTGVGVASCSAGHMDIYAVGQDKHLWTRGTTDNGATWSTWSQLPGIWSSDPGAQCRPGTTTVDVYARGQDFALWQLITTFGS